MAWRQILEVKMILKPRHRHSHSFDFRNEKSSMINIRLNPEGKKSDRPALDKKTNAFEQHQSRAMFSASEPTRCLYGDVLINRVGSILDAGRPSVEDIQKRLRASHQSRKKM